MTDHSIGEADEGSVGLDREEGEHRAKGEHQAAKQKTTTAVDGKRLIINSNLKYSPAQDGNNYESTGERRYPEEQFKKLTPPTWEGKSLPAPDLQLRTLGQGHYCQCVENSANNIFWLVFATLKFSQFGRYFKKLMSTCLI